MISIINDFDKRVNEINIYFKLLEDIDENNAILYFKHKQTHKYKSPDNELIKILKANIFLLLYNLCESSIKQSLNEIYDKISDENVQYELVSDEIKKIWINEKHKNFKNIGTEKIFSSINSLADDIIDIKFDSDKTISGNIDARKIKYFSSLYGFSVKTHKNSKDGQKLLQVKTQRNHLAHGNLSFAECGRNYTTNQLRETKHEVILYLRRILLNINTFIDEKKFLR